MPLSGRLSAKMSHLHFGRAVPVTFRRFPSLLCHNLLGKSVRVPYELEGRLSMLVVGFKTSHYKTMASWIPFASQLISGTPSKHNNKESVAQVYRLVIRQRSGLFFRWWTDERLRLAVGQDSLDNSAVNSMLAMGEDQKNSFGVDKAEEAPKLTAPVGTQNTLHLSSAAESTESPVCPKFNCVLSRTLVSFTDKSAFIEALQLADAQRVYIFLVDKEGEIIWCEHGKHSLSKEIELRKILQLPESNIPSVQLVHKGCGELLPKADCV